MLSEEDREWGVKEWDLRKKEIESVYAGDATFTQINAEMDKRVKAAPFSEDRAWYAIIAAQAADLDAERQRLAKSAKKFVTGYC